MEEGGGTTTAEKLSPIGFDGKVVTSFFICGSESVRKREYSRKREKGKDHVGKKIKGGDGRSQHETSKQERNDAEGWGGGGGATLTC